MKRFFLIVLDGVGAGALPDAAQYGDEKSSTLEHIAEAIGGLDLPNLQAFGLGNIVTIKGVPPVVNPQAAYGKLIEKSAGKDSTIGHWEIAGLITDKPFPLYPNGFPDEILNRFVELTDCGGVLGNIPASGTQIIRKFGRDHEKTKHPIVYTSADSVFQIAAHEHIVPLECLYKWCEIARNDVLVGQHAVARIIARPFIGNEGNYVRTGNRKDFSLEPPVPTLLDYLFEGGINVVGIGKIEDLFAGRGLTKSIHTKTNAEGIEVLVDEARSHKSGLVFINLVDFDQQYGHRNDPDGFAGALTEFDAIVPDLIESLNDGDIMLITSDHGNDPTTPSTDHSREYGILLAYRKGMRRGADLGLRETFADIAQTCAEYFDIDTDSRSNLAGRSFLGDLY